VSAIRAPTITQVMLDLCSALCKARRCATTAHTRGLRALTVPPRRSRPGHYVMVGMMMILNGAIFAVDDIEKRA
jgi:hypothetical protein